MEILFKDNGIGICKEDQDKLFQPYFSTKSYGTGLGLAIVERIVADHQGEISVDSEPGSGTKFTIRLQAP